MPGFVQIMEITTSRIDDVRALTERMSQERGTSLLARRVTLAADRDNPGRYSYVVEFDSYEEAMRNSNDPETSRFAEEMMALLDSPPTFRNLDVVDVLSLRS